MKKYYIGLAVIGLLTLGLIIFGIYQGVSSRQDRETESKSQQIADKLNNYISSKQVIPESLGAAGIKDVPSTVSYTKKSDSSYEFCVTYKSTSNDISIGSFDQVLTGALQRQAGSYNTSYTDYSSTYTPSSLYLPYGHKKGTNCQTIEPYLYGSSSSDLLNNNPTSSASIYDYTSSPNSLSSIDVKSRDTERTTDIKALHGQIEAYYAQNGFYPTLLNINITSWRATNMKGLDQEALKDPQGTTYDLRQSPAKGIYSYDARGADGGACDNTTGKECAIYTLTATLEAGGTFAKNNLN